MELWREKKGIPPLFKSTFSAELQRKYYFIPNAVLVLLIWFFFLLFTTCYRSRQPSYPFGVCLLLLEIYLAILAACRLIYRPCRPWSVGVLSSTKNFIYFLCIAFFCLYTRSTAIFISAVGFPPPMMGIEILKRF